MPIKEETKARSRLRRRSPLVFVPFIVLLIAAIALNGWLVQAQIQAGPAQVSSDPLETAEPSTGQRIEAATPVATAIAYQPEASNLVEETTAPEPPAASTLEPGRSAVILGPPNESRFGANSTVSLYWRAGDENAVIGAAFEVYVFNDQDEHLLGTLEEPNLGKVFQVQFTPSEEELQAGTYRWQVRLRDPATQNVRGVSESRQITIDGSAD